MPDVGRPSIAPERLLRALLLQIFYSVRSERLLMEQLQYNLLFRWFVGMEMERGGKGGGHVWDHAVFSKNRERLLNEEIAGGVFPEGTRPGPAVFVGRAFYGGRDADPEAWASQKRFSGEGRRGGPAGASAR